MTILLRCKENCWFYKFPIKMRSKKSFLVQHNRKVHYKYHYMSTRVGGGGFWVSEKNNKIINKSSKILRQNFYCCNIKHSAWAKVTLYLSPNHDLLSDQKKKREEKFKREKMESFMRKVFFKCLCGGVEERRKEKYLRVIWLRCKNFEAIFLCCISWLTTFNFIIVCLVRAKNAIKIDSGKIYWVIRVGEEKELINKYLGGFWLYVEGQFLYWRLYGQPYLIWTWLIFRPALVKILFCPGRC